LNKTLFPIESESKFLKKMSNFSNESTKIYFDQQLLYERIGSTWLVDSIYALVISPLGMLGFLLNLISCYVSHQIQIKQTKLYEYLTFYSLNSSILSIITGFAFIPFAPRYYSNYLSYTSRIFRSIIPAYVVSSHYFIANIFDIIISLNRLSIFIKRFNFINKISTVKITISIFLFVYIINLPSLFSYYVKIDEQIQSELKFNLSNFNFSGRTDFFS
jgi:hypothetical protein